MAAGVCKRCGEPTGNPDGRQWYCDTCRPLVTAEKARAAFEKRLPKYRQPCAICGGPKGPGERRWYCDTCIPVARERGKQAERDRTRRWLEDPVNREVARARAREQTRRKPRAQANAYIRDWRRRKIAEDPEAWRAKTRAKNARHRAGRNEDLVAYSAIIASDPCAYCGAPFEVVEHIHTRSTGGTNTWDNVTSSCRSCNSKKRDKPLLLALLQRD